MPGAAPKIGSRAKFLAVLATVLLGSAYVSCSAFEHWIPQDEGSIAYPAAQVLRGRIPHVDFSDTYSGGLAHYYAMSFRLFGESLAAIRIATVVIHATFLASLTLILLRFFPPLASVVVAIGISFWGLPNYIAGMPSWYNLFFAMHATYFMIRWIEEGRKRWLVVAGVCAGMSVMIKVAGLYLILGILTFLCFPGKKSSEPHPPIPMVALPLVAVFTFVLFLLHRHLDASHIVLFVVPILLVVYASLRKGKSAQFPRMAELAANLGSLAVGIAIPIGVFVTPYLSAEKLQALFNGLYVYPKVRVASAYYAPPEISQILVGSIFWGLLFTGLRRIKSSKLHAAFFVVAAVLVGLTRQPAVYASAWACLRPLILGLVFVYVFERRTAASDAQAPRTEITMLLVVVATFVNLIQYPYTFGIYFFYVAPMFLVALACLLAQWNLKKMQWAFLAVLFLGLPLLATNPSDFRSHGIKFSRKESTTPLILPAGGIGIPSQYGAQYNRLMTSLADNLAAQDLVYAGPDTPEIYFLLLKPAPDFFLYDIFRPSDSPKKETFLENAAIKYWIVNHAPEFSEPDSAAFLERVKEHFPNVVRTGPYSIYARKPEDLNFSR